MTNIYVITGSEDGVIHGAVSSKRAIIRAMEYCDMPTNVNVYSEAKRELKNKGFAQIEGEYCSAIIERFFD